MATAAQSDDTGGKSAPSQRESLADEVVSEVNRAYYGRLVEAPDRARTRALNGFTVVSAIAAALVAAGLAKGIDGAPGAVQAFGFVSLALWLLAGGAFLAAVADPRLKRKPTGSATNANDAAWDRIEEARREIRSIRVASGAAQVLSAIALVVTIAMVGLALLENGASEWATVTLDRRGATRVAAACHRGSGNAGPTYRVKLDPGSLGDSFPALRFPAGDCRGEEATVYVPAATIWLVATGGG
jgi:hypothetical protein